MSAYRLCYCPNCKSFVTTDSSKDSPRCPVCKTAMKFVPVNMDEYESWDEAKKASFEQKYFADMAQAPANPEQSKQSPPICEKKDTPAFSSHDEPSSDSSIWIVGLEAISWFVLAACVIVGLVLGISSGSLSGIVLFILCALGGFLVVGMTMVFLGMARDLKAIRNALEEK